MGDMCGIPHTVSDWQKHLGAAIRRRPGRAVLLGAALAGAVVAMLTASRASYSLALSEAQTSAMERAVTARGLLSSELQKFRLLPLVMANASEVQQALATRSPVAVAQLNRRLELVAQRTDAAVIYVIDREGETIAASNWRTPSSFVGQNYGFRPYFRDALRTGSAEQFALGTVSRRPGLFLARRVAEGGIVVAKVEFDILESAWAHQPGATIVRDRNGVVIMTSRPAWRLHRTRELSSAELAVLRSARLYGDIPPPSLAPQLALLPDGTARDERGRLFALASLPIAVTGWSVTTLEPLEPALTAASAQFRVIVLILLLILVVAGGLWLRARDKAELQRQARLELEREVELRTAELRGANESLVHESRERERNEKRLARAREDLAQSNRLATVGQITAGVAHEINQPLAALRTFAESAQTLIERDLPQEAATNLGHIVSLTSRIGEITSELRLFSRKEGGNGPSRLGDCIDGAAMLVGDRIHQGRIHFERDEGMASDALVAIDRLRMEQILINLLQNAIDAVTGCDAATIRLSARCEERLAVVRVEDNGPGVPAARRKDLFKSFRTSKLGGLGLGLVISRDLAREVGGDLIHCADTPGAVFEIRLPIA